ncbi:MAG: PIN domain-containing protein [Desulfuromonas thiophila]|jgi:predicted nucleic acid-binding protein|nr:PIN domain-containing protein [Desulfuromonas thiophila]
MNVLVDTCVWSLALRRKQLSDDAIVLELRELISELRVLMIGPIRQELLSGVRSPAQFSNLRDRLQAFPDLELTVGDFERAAEFFNSCRAKGIQGSNTDFLICAVSDRLKIPILTTDGDFELFRQIIPVRLHRPRSEC